MAHVAATAQMSGPTPVQQAWIIYSRSDCPSSNGQARADGRGTKRGGIILDCFLGSGATLLAAERSKRRSRGIELDPAYVDVAIRRWEKLTGKTAIHEETGLTYATLGTQRAEIIEAAA